MNNNKYKYATVIQQHYGRGWEDVSEYETDSSYSPKERTDKGTALLYADLKEYKLLGYPTRTINRRNLVQQTV